jgi:4-amino-4-deoxy-L-arabinose transferase-like glycosyltransferase
MKNNANPVIPLIESDQETPRLEVVQPTTANANFRTLFAIVLTGLAVRLIVGWFLYPDNMGPAHDHFKFGFETGRIARSLAQGEGFSSPLFAKTGPTAWMTPVYPWIVAGFFKVFGVYTKSALFAILSFQALISSLTSIPIFYFARNSFGSAVGKWAGWTWAFFPYAIYFPMDRIWETWLATLLFALVFLVSQKLEDEDRISAWIGAGLLWGLTALTSAALIAVLPFLQANISYHRQQKSRPWLVPNLALGLAFIAATCPWFIRNYRVFHAFIPFRDNMGLVLRLGAKGANDDWKQSQFGPWLNDAEAAEFHRDGEIKYFATKKAQAINFIKHHPGVYAWQTLRRIVFVWTGYWSLDKDYLARDEAQWDLWNIPFCTAFTILALIGLRKAWRRNRDVEIPYAILMLVFPIVYYITAPELYYRRPLDPMMVVLTVYALVPVAGEGFSNRWAIRGVMTANKAATVRGSGLL